MGKIIEMKGISKKINTKQKSFTNLSLAKELSSRGFFVQPINRGDEIEYLIVTTQSPKPFHDDQK